MKNVTRMLALMMAVVMLLCGCGGQTPAGGEGTTAASEPAITTEEALRSALESEARVTLGGDIALTSEIVVSGHVFDGGGYTITGPKYVEGQAETENAITVSGGTVENVSVKGAYRGIGDSAENPSNSDVRLNNVHVDSDIYTLNFGYGSDAAGMYVENSTLRGWTSYAKFKEARFTNCTFGWSESGAYGTLRPYINTTLIGCKLEGKTEADGTLTPFNLSFKSGSAGIELILENCYVGDTLITQENLEQLVTVEAHGNSVQVRNTTN